jgi:putative PIN family toxin of toxin-antitoxin system
MRPRRPRAVLDTQLLIRAFHTARGATGGLVRALQDDRFHLISSEPLLEELRRTFYRPEVQRIAPLRPLLPHEIEDNIASVRAIAAVVVPGRYQVDLVSTDPKDNPVLACAIEGLADYVVTDDRRDLLPLKVVRLAGHAAIQIVSAAGFLRILHD